MEFLKSRCGFTGIGNHPAACPRDREHRHNTPASAGAFEEYKMEIILWIVLAAVVVFAALYVAKNDPFGINPK